jgi:hypothetical protein
MLHLGAVHVVVVAATSASFTYLEMEKFWRAEELERK